jgi:hypothetical protein
MLEAENKGMCQTYLEMMATVGSAVGEMYLTLGRRFEPAPLPAGLSRGQPRQCYRNAGEEAVADRRWAYAEGYAACRGVFPVHHAWLVDEQGFVLDPTWEFSEKNEYFGLVFSTEALLHHLETVQTWGILAEMIPLQVVRAHPSSYLHTRWRPQAAVMDAFAQRMRALLEPAERAPGLAKKRIR